MQKVAVLDGYVKARFLFFKWRYSLALAQKLGLALGMACLTGLAAQMRVALPWTPVPITGQTFAALLAGVLLGRWWGGISMLMYLVLGVAGIPWFSGASGGYAALIGPTGGYILGFIFAALFIGHFTQRYIRARSFFSLLLLMCLANFALIHIPGLLQLGLWFRLIRGASPGLGELFLLGTVPFIIGDITKIVAAAAVALAITPKQPYNGEADSAVIASPKGAKQSLSLRLLRRFAPRNDRG